LVDIIDRDNTQKQLGNGKVLHLIADDTFGPHNPMSGEQHSGIRPRWARVLAVGPEVDQIAPGDLVLCDYGKWSRGIPLGRDGLELVRFWRIRVGDILLVDTAADGSEYLRSFEAKLSRMSLTIGRI
jgi:hypothetical protein